MNTRVCVWEGGGWSYLTSALHRDRSPAQRSSRWSSINLDGPHSWCGRYGEERNLLPLLGIEPRFLDSLARSLVAISALDNKCNAYNVLVRHLRQPKRCLNYAFCHEDV
jgi:hypothetical protein